MARRISACGDYLKRTGIGRTAKRDRRRHFQPSRSLRYEPLEDRTLLSIYYVESVGGNDAWSGLAGTYTSGSTGPWKTLDKVNGMTFAAGDQVLFKRGDTWRGQLVTDPGSASGRITYSAYGDPAAAKPQLLGSEERDSTADWIHQGANVWSTKSAVDLVTTTGSEMLSNSSFTSNTTGWTAFRQSPASTLATYGRYTGDYDSSPACYRLQAGSNPGDSYDDIALRTNRGMSIVAGRYYLLTFRAKANPAFTLDGIVLHKNGSPATSYVGVATDSSFNLTTGWTTYKALFKAGTTAPDAVLSFYMGNTSSGDGINGNGYFYIDTLSLKACTPQSEQRLLDVDVGNVIFNNSSCAMRRYLLNDAAGHSSQRPYPYDQYTGLHNQGDYFYDATDWTVKVYSTSNPATYYSDIEMALGTTIVAGTDYVTVQSLDVRYGGFHGIQLLDAEGYGRHDFTVSGCDVAFVGGVCDFASRMGNGIEVFGNAYNVLIEGCSIWDVYDSGITNQSLGTYNSQHDIVYRNNIIGNCEWSYEFYGDVTTPMYNVYFENNTCVDAGYGWSSNQQRPGNTGEHLEARNLVGDMISNYYIRNNIFYESTGAFIRVDFAAAYPKSWDNLRLDNNLYYTSANAFWSWSYTPLVWYYPDRGDFVRYQADTGEDAHSILATTPVFIDAANRDFRLRSTSLAIDAGTNNGIGTDFSGMARPQGPAYDMGAYEYVYTSPMVSSVIPNLTTVADANAGNATFWSTLAYNEPMNTAVAPIITFPAENPSSTLSFNSGLSNWTDSTTYVAKYNVADANVALSNVHVRVTGAQDAAGNVQTQGDFADKFSIDTQNPTVTINQASGQADPTTASPINFTVVFSEAVADLVTGDVTFSGTAPGALVGMVTGSGTTYNAAVTGMTGEGTVIPRLLAGAAHDAAGNSNVASTSSDGTVMYDPTPVTVTSVVVNDGNAQRSKVSSLVVTFSEFAAIDTGAFEMLQKGTGGGLVTVAMSLVAQNGRTVVTLTFSGSRTEYGSLTDGEYQLTIYGSKVHDSNTGTNLDGDNDGVFGGNCLFGALAADKFFRKFGDADGDRDVDSVDLLAFRQAYSGSYKWYFDFDSDGDVDSVDLLRFRQRYA